MAIYDEFLKVSDIEETTFNQIKEITIKSTDLENPIINKIGQENKPIRKKQAYDKRVFDEIGIRTIKGL